MCGIIGFSSKTNTYNLEKIKTLLLCNSYERGGDGVGVYTPKSGIIKNNIPAERFILSEEFKTKLLDDKTLLAHARKSSSGQKTINNTHPFEYDDIIAVHNGTLQKHFDLAKDYNLKHDEWYIDSHVICKALSLDLLNNGYEKYPKVFNKYKGFATVVYYSKKTNSLYVHRDQDRAIYYGFIDNSIYISSLDYSLKLIGCEVVNVFEPNKIYTIKNGSIVNILDKPIDKNYIKLASSSDIDKKYVFTKLSYEINIKGNGFTGFEKSVLDIEPKALIGYKLKYIHNSINYADSYQCGEKEANVTKNNFYQILDARREYDSVAKTTDIQFKFIDNKKQEKWLSNSKFDITNFIFVNGNYALVTANLFNTKTDEKVANKGEFVKILNHKFGEKDCYVKFVSGKCLWCDLDYLEVLTEENNIAASKVFNKQEESPFIEDKASNDIKLLNAAVLEEDDMTDDENDKKEELDDEEYLDFTVVKAYLKNICGSLDNLSKKRKIILSEEIYAITNKIKKIKKTSDIIDLVYDGKE